MTISVIMSNSPNNVGVAYSFVSWLNNNDISKPYIDLNIHHFNEGPNVHVKKPVIFMIHGGGWYVGDKDNFDNFKPKFFNDLGCIYVSINYRLSRPFGITTEGAWIGNGTDNYASWDVNRVKHPKHIKDITNALKWVRDNIQNYGGDPNKISVFGHSAGAHLAVLLCSNTSYINNVGIPTSCIKTCVSLDTNTFNISNEINSSDATAGAPASVLSRNAFGVPYDSGRSFNDFVSTIQQNQTYDDGSPELFVSSGIVTNFLMCTRGTASRINSVKTFVESLSSVGIGTSICIYIGSNTYSHEEIQYHVGNPLSVPEGKSLPTSDQISQGASSVDISTFITNHLTRIGFI